MNRERTRQYKQQVEQAIASSKLQEAEALHKFGDAFLLARKNA